MVDVAMMSRGLSVLLAISWVMLVMRAVHAEGLVGDRQFWLTRPYEWKSVKGGVKLYQWGGVIVGQ
jgi:hypothetical protein